eukprot:887191-Prorocentrum_minimum.AAC.1
MPCTYSKYKGLLTALYELAPHYRATPHGIYLVSSRVWRGTCFGQCKAAGILCNVRICETTTNTQCEHT